MSSIRILLINGQKLIPGGVQGMQELQEDLVQGMLEMEEDMQIIGDYASAEEVLHQPEILLPSVVLMEAKMPGMDGIETTRRLHRKWASCKVIMLTWHEDCLAEALEAGVAGYFLKDIKYQELIQIIRRVYHGELVIDERLTSTPEVVEGESEYLPPEVLGEESEYLPPEVLGEESEYLLPEVEGAGPLVKVAELVIPPPVDAARLLRFIYHVEEALEATIMQQVGSWDRATAITILLRRAAPLVNIIDKLGKMPDVDSVREEPGAKNKFAGFPRKIVTEPQAHPQKELLVTLKQDSPAEEPELAELKIS